MIYLMFDMIRILNIYPIYNPIEKTKKIVFSFITKYFQCVTVYMRHCHTMKIFWKQRGAIFFNILYSYFIVINL